LISSSYYWSIAKDAEKINSNTGWKKDAETFSKMIAKRVSPHVGFFAIDVAKTESGDWIVIEINDGQMSGLSMIDPKQFYKNLEPHISIGPYIRKYDFCHSSIFF
jgi:hypothetical protein